MSADDIYAQGTNEKCPHCGCTVLFQSPAPVIQGEGTMYARGMPTACATVSGGDFVVIYSSKCPNPKCQKPIVTMKLITDGDKVIYRLVHPSNVVRIVPPEVPKEIKEDFQEASSVISLSEKASAALSRRCLQNMLNERGFKGKDLNAQIDSVLKILPTEIAFNLDAIRQIGNFAAHPMKSELTGEIVDVEKEEASWNLDVLEQLFDFFYVQPKTAEEKRKKLDAKLASLGKPPLKKP